MIQRLVSHQFGNYVLQKAIAIISDSQLKTQILEAIKVISNQLMHTKHGSKVLVKLAKQHSKAFEGTNLANPKKFSYPMQYRGNQNFQKKKAMNNRKDTRYGISANQQ